jgi:hypothetical protein
MQHAVQHGAAGYKLQMEGLADERSADPDGPFE